MSSPNTPHEHDHDHDVVIIGGSYAGLAAALQIARTGRRVLVLDAGRRRNHMVTEAHGYLGFDGVSPAEIAERGRRDVLAYPNVTLVSAFAEQARKGAVGSEDEGWFVVKTPEQIVRGRRLILATGVTDELGDLPGLREGWGHTIFACPYCHGHEAAKGPFGVAVLAASEHAYHHACLVADWSPRGKTTLFLNDAFSPDEAQTADLDRRGIVLERGAVARVEGESGRVTITMADGQSATFNGVFTMSRTGMSVPFAEQLGCELEASPFGPTFKTDPMRETTVPGVFACGDNATMGPSVTTAVYTGMMAGVAAHQSLVFRPAALLSRGLVDLPQPAGGTRAQPDTTNGPSAPRKRSLHGQGREVWGSRRTRRVEPRANTLEPSIEVTSAAKTKLDWPSLVGVSVIAISPSPRTGCRY